VGAELFHADRRTYMMKPIVAFHNFLNAPKNCLTLKLIVNKVTPRLYTVKHNQESSWGGGGTSGGTAPDGKININEKKIQHSSNFKLFRPVKGNSISNLDAFKVHNSCNRRPLYMGHFKSSAHCTFSL
jgi:hypothetical protein